MGANVPRPGIGVQRAARFRTRPVAYVAVVGCVWEHASPPMIRLGVDTLCWHLRLEARSVTLEDVLDGAAALEAEFVQVNLHHVRDRELDDVMRLSVRADELGLRLLASGDFLGQGRDGDAPALGIGRIHGWLERAVAL